MLESWLFVKIRSNDRSRDGGHVEACLPHDQSNVRSWVQIPQPLLRGKTKVNDKEAGNVVSSLEWLGLG